MSSIEGFDSDLSVAGTVDSESFDASNPSNLGGWNSNIQDDSWEADEERRILAERLEKERLAKLEAERLEKIRLAEIEAEKIRLEQERLEKIRLEKERLDKIRLEKERLEEIRLKTERYITHCRDMIKMRESAILYTKNQVQQNEKNIRNNRSVQHSTKALKDAKGQLLYLEKDLVWWQRNLATARGV